MRTSGPTEYRLEAVQVPEDLEKYLLSSGAEPNIHGWTSIDVDRAVDGTWACGE